MALFILSLDGTCYSSTRIIYRTYNKWGPTYVGPNTSSCMSPVLLYSAPPPPLPRLPACSCVLCSIPPFQSKIKAPQQEVLGAQVGRLVSLWKMPAGANPSRHEYCSWPMCSLMTISLHSFSKVLGLGREMFHLHLICDAGDQHWADLPCSFSLTPE